jgi:hypothetical protein
MESVGPGGAKLEVPFIREPWASKAQGRPVEETISQIAKPVDEFEFRVTLMDVDPAVLESTYAQLITAPDA